MDLGGELKRSLEGFQEVPVISFGWVALFIVLYTLLIGPVEYYFLKRVLGRLERELGVPVVEDAAHTGALPGKVLRRDQTGAVW